MRKRKIVKKANPRLTRRKSFRGGHTRTRKMPEPGGSKYKKRKRKAEQ